MFNPSDFQYRAQQTAAAQHDRNAVNLDARAKDTRYQAAQRQTFARMADEERQAATLARSDAAFYKSHGFHNVRIAIAA